MMRGRIRSRLIKVDDLSRSLRSIYQALTGAGTQTMLFNGYISDVWPAIYTRLVDEVWLQAGVDSPHGGKTVIFQGCPGIGKTHALAGMLAYTVATGGEDYAGYKWDKIFYLAPTHKLLKKMAVLVEKELDRRGLRVRKPLILYNSPANCKLNRELVKRAYRLVGFHSSFCRYCIEKMVERLLGSGGKKGKRGGNRTCGSITGTCLGDYVAIVGEQVKNHAVRENRPVVGPEYNLGVYPVCLRKLVLVMLTWLWQRSSKKSGVGRKVQWWYLGALLPYQTIITPHVIRTWLVGERKDSAWLFIFDEADTIVTKLTPMTVDIDELDPTDLDLLAMEKVGVSDSHIKRLREALKKISRSTLLIGRVPKRAFDVFVNEILPTLREMKVEYLLNTINRLAYEKDRESNLYKPLNTLMAISQDPFLYDQKSIIKSTGNKIHYYSPFLTLEMLFDTELPTKATTKFLVSATFASNASVADYVNVRPKLMGGALGGGEMRIAVALAEYRYDGLYTIYHNLYDLGLSLTKGDIYIICRQYCGQQGQQTAPNGDYVGQGYSSIHMALAVEATASILGLVYFASMLSRVRGGTGNVLLWVNSKQDAGALVSMIDMRFSERFCVYEESKKDYYVLRCRSPAGGDFKTLVSWYRGRLARGLDISTEGFSVSIALGFANPVLTDFMWEELLRYSSSAEMLQAVFRVVRNPRLDGTVIALPAEIVKMFGSRSQPYDFNFMFEKTVNVDVSDLIRFLVELAGGPQNVNLTGVELCLLGRSRQDLFGLLQLEKVSGRGGVI